MFLWGTWFMLLVVQITHLHDFVRETGLTTEEWMYGGFILVLLVMEFRVNRTAIDFLTKTGQKCTDIRQGIFVHLSS